VGTSGDAKHLPNRPSDRGSGGGGSQREWLQPILEEEGEGRPPMALRTEQTTMGRATDPKEQRRSAKRGRGPTAPVRRAFERPFGPPAVGHTNDHGAQGTREEGTCEGGRRGDFHRRMRWGGEGRRGRVYVRIAGGSTPVCSAQVGASQSQGGFWGPLGGRRADGPLV
jgi:hypothetical protein